MKYIVLHSLSRMDRGGAETLIMNIFRNIDRENFCFYFLLNSEECDYSEEIKSLGGKIYCIPSRSEGVVKYCRTLDKFFSEHKGEFQAVHMHTSSLSSLELLYYAKKHGVKMRIIHSHNTIQTGLIHNVLHWLQKPVLKHLATNYLSCSKVASKWLYQYTGVINKSVVINNGINLNQFAYNASYRDEIRRLLGIRQDTKVIGHVGRFDEVKNHIFLIEIFNKFLKINSDSKLVCIGVGGTMESIKIRIKNMELDEKVLFLGLQSEIYKFLSAFDYFVFPSLYEGLPVALVEAQASGVRTICSNKVSEESKLSDCLSFFPIEKTAENWAEYINELKDFDRTSSILQIEKNGYSINNTVQYLSHEIYV